MLEEQGCAGYLTQLRVVFTLGVFDGTTNTVRGGRNILEAHRDVWPTRYEHIYVCMYVLPSLLVCFECSNHGFPFGSNGVLHA
jgi:hypothetical protein